MMHLIFRKIVSAVRNPRRTKRILSLWIDSAFNKKGVLFFVGMDPDGEFKYLHRGYRHCYIFEANPKRFMSIVSRYQKYSHIHLYNMAAATQHNGEVVLNISSNNNGASSSLGDFNKGWKHRYRGEPVQMVDSVTVKSVNLGDFCEQHNINYIDDYVSDIQGMDLCALETLKPMIDTNCIGSIRCEVARNDKGSVYSGLPDNSEAGFARLLDSNYELVARGYGILEPGHDEVISSEQWEMDCLWRGRL